MLNSKKATIIIFLIFSSIVFLRVMMTRSLRPSLGLDTVYLQTVDVFDTLSKESFPSVFNPHIDISLPLTGWFKGLDYDGDHQILLLEGGLSLKEVDFEVFPRGKKGAYNPLSFMRNFSSLKTKRKTPTGYGWTPYWDFKVFLIEDVYVFQTPSGHCLSFKFDTASNRYKVIKGGRLKYRMESKDNKILLWSFKGQAFEFVQDEARPEFKLAHIIHSNGIRYKLKRDGKGAVQAIEEVSSGRSTEYRYDREKGVINRVKFPSGKEIYLEYDAYTNLVAIRHDLEGEPCWVYRYKDEMNMHNLTNMGRSKPFYTFRYNNGKIIEVDGGEFGKVHFDRDELLGSVRTQLMNGSVFKYHQKGSQALSISGPIGYSVKIQHDENGLPVKMTDSQDRVTMYSWNQDYLAIQKEDASRALEIFDYDNNFNLISYTDGAGNETRYDYEEGQLLREISPAGEITKYEYEGGHLIAIQHPGNSKRKHYTYDSSGLVVSTLDEEGSRTSFKYNRDGYPEEKKSPLGYTEEYKWENGFLRQLRYQFADDSKKKVFSYKLDPCGRIRAKRNAQEREINYEYDLLGRVKLVQYPRGENVKLSWTGEGLLRAFERDTGEQYEIKYDELNRPLTIFKGDSEWAKFEYRKDRGVPIRPFSSLFSSYVNPNGNIIKCGYDENYRVNEVIWPNGEVESFEYNNGGKVSSRRRNNGPKTFFSYDKNQNLEYLFRNEDEEVHIFKHDWRGNLISYTGVDSNSIRLKYDALGRPIEVGRDFTTPIMTWAWDMESKLIQSKSMSGDSMVKSYNGLNHVVSQHDQKNGTKEFIYDSNGLLDKVINSSGGIVEYGYHENGLVKEKKYIGDQVNYSYTYDLTKNLKKMTGVASCQYTWENGRPIKLAFDKKNILLLAYNAKGLVAKKTYPGLIVQTNKYNDSGKIQEISENNLDPIKYEYDKFGRVILIKFPNSTFTRYEYDVQSRVISIVTENEEGDTLYKRLYEYDLAGRLERVVTERRSLSYEYDSDGRILSEDIDDKKNTNLSYQYDEMGRLSKEKVSTSKSDLPIVYYYDKQGRIRKKAFEKGSKDGLKESFRLNIQGKVDKEPGFLEINEQVMMLHNKRFTVGNVLVKSGRNSIPIKFVTPTGKKRNESFYLDYQPENIWARKYNESGRKIFESYLGKNTAFEYNDENYIKRMVANLGGKLKYHTFSYYGNGCLAFKDIQIEGVNSNKNKHKFIFDENHNIIGEFPANGSGYNHLYMYTPSGNILYRIDRGHKKFYYHLDKDGSVIGVTNHLGKIVCSYAYDSKGRLTFKKEKSVNSFRYLGHYQEPHTGFYFNQGFVGGEEEHSEMYSPTIESLPLDKPSRVAKLLFPFYFNEYPHQVKPKELLPKILNFSIEENAKLDIPMLTSSDYWVGRQNKEDSKLNH